MKNTEKKVKIICSSHVKSNYTPDNGPGKHKIGLVLLSNDYVAERDFINVRPNVKLLAYQCKMEAQGMPAKKQRNRF